MLVIVKDIKISVFVAVIELFISVTNSNLMIVVVFSFITCLLVLKFDLHGHRVLVFSQIA